MKKIMILASVVLLSTGCSGVVAKNFKVFAEPPDAVIRVVSGTELREQKYTSPAKVSVEVPTDPALEAKAVLEVSREDYTPRSFALKDIGDGSTLNIKLVKILRDIVRYRLSYRMITPEASPDLRYQDKVISVSWIIGDQGFQLRLENMSSHDLKILWDRAEYLDTNKQSHRIMHSGIRYQDRNNPIPNQFVLAGQGLQTVVIPVKKVVFSQQKKTYEIQSLLPLDSEAAVGLKGKTVNLFIPIEVNRQIIPYNFKFEIIDAVKETTQG